MLDTNAWTCLNSSCKSLDDMYQIKQIFTAHEVITVKLKTCIFNTYCKLECHKDGEIPYYNTFDYKMRNKITIYIRLMYKNYKIPEINSK